LASGNNYLRHISKSSTDKRMQSDKVSRYAHSYCTSQTNWYANFSPDPSNAPCVQLEQPFFNLIDSLMGLVTGKRASVILEAIHI
jgi:hypothetical protein